jgi:hypothetical protein
LYNREELLLHEELADKKSAKKGGTREREGLLGVKASSLGRGENHLSSFFNKSLQQRGNLNLSSKLLHQ